MQGQYSIAGIIRPWGVARAISLLILMLIAAGLPAQSRIIFAEAQLAGSWESLSGDFRPYTVHPHEVMQKPSLGFDLVQRLGNREKDWGYLAVQARVAYTDSTASHLEPQLYNAFLNIKTDPFDLWLGHNKPALGLARGWDNHAQVLTDNTMSGLVFDRDWGVGISADRGNPTLEASLTTGSGMSLYWDESWLLAARAGLGDYNSDYFSAHLGGAVGNVFKTMGYNIMHNKVPHRLILGGVDLSRRIMNWELRGDALYGSFHDDPAYTALARIIWYPMPEDRVVLAIQGQAQELKGSALQNYSFGVEYRISADLTLRGAYTLQQPTRSHTLALQVYFLKALPI